MSLATLSSSPTDTADEHKQQHLLLQPLLLQPLLQQQQQCATIKATLAMLRHVTMHACRRAHTLPACDSLWWQWMRHVNARMSACARVDECALHETLVEAVWQRATREWPGLDCAVHYIVEHSAINAEWHQTPHAFASSIVVALLRGSTFVNGGAIDAIDDTDIVARYIFEQWCTIASTKCGE